MPMAVLGAFDDLDLPFKIKCIAQHALDSRPETSVKSMANAFEYNG